jgi:hypothetical protein
LFTPVIETSFEVENLLVPLLETIQMVSNELKLLKSTGTVICFCPQPSVADNFNFTEIV